MNERIRCLCQWWYRYEPYWTGWESVMMGTFYVESLSRVLRDKSLWQNLL